MKFAVQSDFCGLASTEMERKRCFGVEIDDDYVVFAARSSYRALNYT